MFVFKAGVVGAGTMGPEIAAVIAAAGLPVVLCDIDPGQLEQGRARAEAVTRRPLDALVAAGRLDAERAAAQVAATLELITTATVLEALGDADLVVEAVPERLELKREVIAQLDAATSGQAILASNTSSLSISDLADATTRPERVLGLHFFHPASVMRLVEVVEGLETSAEAMAAATSFVAQIRRTAVRCGDAPGFVVNRVLCSAAGEVWRAQQADGLGIAAVDRAFGESKLIPMGPFQLADMVGLDTVLAVVERLRDAYGERFWVHERLRALVAAGELGLKSGRGFYVDGEARDDDGADALDGAELAERFALKALVESCLVLEDGVASAREIDLALAMGAGFAMPPFAGADVGGLDRMLERLERATSEWGDAYTPPAILRRLVSGGRLGVAAGQGFFPHPRPDAGQEGPIRIESRGEVAIAWLDNPPANSLSPAVLDALRSAWDALVAAGAARALVIASANPALFSAGADIKALAAMEAPQAGELAARMNALGLAMGRSSIVTIAAVGGLAYGGGCELAMIADIRVAAQSASFAQPEIKLGIMPGFGGTQRLSRLVGSGRALELNLLGEPIDASAARELGLVNRVVPDHELLDVALAWARRLAAQAPLSVERIKQVAAGPGLEAGLEREQAAFSELFGSEDAREGTAAFVEKRPPRFTGA